VTVKVNHNAVETLGETASQRIDRPRARNARDLRVGSYKAAVHISSNPHRSRSIACQFLNRVHDREIGKRLVEPDEQVCGVDAAGVNEAAGEPKRNDGCTVVLYGISLTRRREMGGNPVHRQGDRERGV